MNTPRNTRTIRIARVVTAVLASLALAGAAFATSRPNLTVYPDGSRAAAHNPVSEVQIVRTIEIDDEARSYAESFGLAVD